MAQRAQGGAVGDQGARRIYRARWTPLLWGVAVGCAASDPPAASDVGAPVDAADVAVVDSHDAVAQDAIPGDAVDHDASLGDPEDAAASDVAPVPSADVLATDAPEVDVEPEGCAIAGVLPGAVRCPTPTPYALGELGGAPLVLTWSSAGVAASAHLLTASGALGPGVVLAGQPSGRPMLGRLVSPCGGGACVTLESTEGDGPRIFRQTLRVLDGVLIAEPPSASVLLQANEYVVDVVGSDPPVLLLSQPGGATRRCVLSATAACEDFPLPVTCAASQALWLTDALEVATGTVVAGFCEDPVVAALGVGHPFFFEWRAGSGVAWSASPPEWSGRVLAGLHAGADGVWVTAAHFPQGGTDDGTAPVGVSAAQLTQGALESLWDSPLVPGYGGGERSTVVDGALLMAWSATTGDPGGPTQLTRLTGAFATTAALTTGPAWPEGLVAIDGGAVLLIAGHLVRLDTNGAPVPWPQE